jgi:hypothetical protein
MLRRFQFGQFLFGAGDVGFSRAAQSEELLLALQIGFRRLELGALAFNGGTVSRFDRVRKQCFGFDQLFFRDFAGGHLFFFLHNVFLRPRKPRVLQI